MDNVNKSEQARETEIANWVAMCRCDLETATTPNFLWHPADAIRAHALGVRLEGI